MKRLIAGPSSHRVVRSGLHPSLVLALRPSSSTTSRTTCSSCGAPLPASLLAKCPSCAAFLPPPASDAPPTHFDLFELPSSFAVDRGELKRRFLRWQQQVHPDTVRGNEDRQASWAREWSGRVNGAFKSLDEPLPRAEYMLSLEGAEVGEADKADDPELLMAILETREALEEAETEEDVAKIRAENQETLSETIEALSRAFEPPTDLPEAKRLSIKLRYYQNIEDVCREWAPGRPIELQH